jgi:hypothetical protein
MPNSRSAASRMKVMPMTGVASTWMMLVAYIPQMKRGIRDQVIPGARCVWIVMMKLRPVRIDDIPTRNRPKESSVTAAPDFAE